MKHLLLVHVSHVLVHLLVGRLVALLGREGGGNLELKLVETVHDDTEASLVGHQLHGLLGLDQSDENIYVVQTIFAAASLDCRWEGLNRSGSTQAGSLSLRALAASDAKSSAGGLELLSLVNPRLTLFIAQSTPHGTKFLDVEGGRVSSLLVFLALVLAEKEVGRRRRGAVWLWLLLIQDSLEAAAEIRSISPIAALFLGNFGLALRGSSLHNRTRDVESGKVRSRCHELPSTKTLKDRLTMVSPCLVAKTSVHFRINNLASKLDHVSAQGHITAHIHFEWLFLRKL
mmetsp:Transcript_45938/g.144111  ORF Transcript_45938/g.144111 Transcript_45938/m.144111 type:complete len:287 (+) Transcript_45938:263-1123(+)